MSLLMPEYERQLHAAARRLASDPAAARRLPSDPAASAAPAAPAAPATRPRVGLGSRLFLGLATIVAISLAVAVAGVVLVGHHGSPGAGTPGAALLITQYDCAPHEILPAKGRLVATAHGTVAGQRWTLEVDSARPGLASVQAGRFLLGGHAYGFCQTGLDLELVNAGFRGIVYGLAARPYRPPIVIEATTGHGTAAHPVRAHRYPATTRQVAGATLFLRALPASACAYRALAVAAPQRPTIVGAGQATLALTGSFTRACLPGQLLQTTQPGAGPTMPQLPPPPGLSARARAEYDAGRAEVGNAGCLACHQIGDQGNHGPGRDLTHIGSSLSRRALQSALVNPPAPMPSFRSLPARSRRAIIAFLRELR